MLDSGIQALIARTYTTGFTDGGLDAVLEDLRERIGADTGLIAIPRETTFSLDHPRLFGRTETRHARGVEELADHCPYDPTFSFFVRRPGARHFDTLRDIDRAVLDSSPYVKWYRSAFRSSDWSVCYHKSAKGHLSLSFQLGEEAAARFGASRALHHMMFNHIAIAFAAVPGDLSARDDPCMLLGVDGSVLDASEAGRALLARGDGLMLLNGIPVAQAAYQRKFLKELVRSALAVMDEGGAGDHIALERGSGGPPLIVRVRPRPHREGLNRYRPMALIEMHDRATPVAAGVIAAWRCLWHLTPAECALTARLLGNGCDLRDAAAYAGVSYATVRTQIASILSKTECHSQAELMTLVASLPA